MRVVKNRQSRNNVPDNDTITPAGYTHVAVFRRVTVPSYRAPNYVARPYDKTSARSKVTE